MMSLLEGIPLKTGYNQVLKETYAQGKTLRGWNTGLRFDY